MKPANSVIRHCINMALNVIVFLIKMRIECKYKHIRYVSIVIQLEQYINIVFISKKHCVVSGLKYLIIYLILILMKIFITSYLRHWVIQQFVKFLVCTVSHSCPARAVIVGPDFSQAQRKPLAQ